MERFTRKTEAPEIPEPPKTQETTQEKTPERPEQPELQGTPQTPPEEQESVELPEAPETPRPRLIASKKPPEGVARKYPIIFPESAVFYPQKSVKDHFDRAKEAVEKGEIFVSSSGLFPSSTLAKMRNVCGAVASLYDMKAEVKKTAGVPLHFVEYAALSFFFEAYQSPEFRQYLITTNFPRKKDVRISVKNLEQYPVKLTKSQYEEFCDIFNGLSFQRAIQGAPGKIYAWHLILIATERVLVQIDSDLERFLSC